MPTVYHHPLTQSVEANTVFNPVIPAQYETSAESSIYTIVSNNIFIGGPQTETITFTCNNFKDVTFQEQGCGSYEEGPRTMTLEEIFKLTDTIKVDNGVVIFDMPVTFYDGITVYGDAEFNDYVKIKDPSYIIFTDLDLNLEQYISSNNWVFSGNIQFTNTVTFAGADKIKVDSNTTLEQYVAREIAERSKLRIVICSDGNLPPVSEAEDGVLYLVPDDVDDPSYYTEYILIEDEQGKRFEKIGTTDTDLSGVIKKDDNNALPNYTNPEYEEYSGRPGIMFDGKFYSFEILEDLDPESLDARYVKKLPECNEMEPYGQEIGLCFNGNFYSFESLCTKQFKGPKFDADNVEIPLDTRTATQIYTVIGAKTSVRITPINDSAENNYLILDAICVDQNSNVWMEIDYIDREPDVDGKMGVNMTIIPLSPIPDPVPDLTAWLSIKTIDTVTGEIFDSQIFFRNKDTITIPEYHAHNKFKYKVNTDSSYTSLEENNLVIDIETGTETIKLTHDCFILLDVHLVSEEGMCSVSGFSNNVITLNVDGSKSGEDWLAIKCLNDVDGVVFYRSIKLVK